MLSTKRTLTDLSLVMAVFAILALGHLLPASAELPAYGVAIVLAIVGLARNAVTTARFLKTVWQR
jgi:hypothetical protein